MRLKSRVPGWGDPPQSGPSKILNFQTVTARWIKFSEWVDVKNKLNLTKTGGALPNGPSKIQIF